MDGPPRTPTDLSERVRFDVRLVLDRVLHLVRNADAPSLRQSADARRDVDAVAGDLPFVHNHVAQVDAHVQLQLRVITSGCFDRQRAVHRVERCGKRGERLVTPRLDRLPVIRLDQRAHQCAMPLPSPQPLILALCHQGRVAHDVGEHDGDEFALGADLVGQGESSGSQVYPALDWVVDPAGADRSLSWTGDSSR